LGGDLEFDRLVDDCQLEGDRARAAPATNCRETVR